MIELIDLFTNNGIAVACLIYFMWYNNTTIKELQETIKQNSEILLSLKENCSFKNEEKE